ncbi:MAG TPA: ROK family protein [Bacteroidia bacterium]|nr:ROK family protein [Bacteroidia bacterium]
MKLVAGIDIGGTNSRFGLVDSGGKIVAHDSVKTTDFPDANDLAIAAAEKIYSMLPKDSELIGAGIGAPNGNFFSGTIEFAPNLQWKGVVPLAKYFSDALNCKAILTNDAKAAALGEMIFGGAKGMKDFIFITLGTGLGSGIVVNGELVYGHDGFAGEAGHVIIIPDGRLCGCGRRGCLEKYCSATGIVTTYKEKLSDAGEKIPDDEIDSKYIFEKAQQGEQIAIGSFNYTGELLGLALANTVTYTSPEAIFLFGGLAQAEKFIFSPVKESFEKNILRIYKDKVKILPSKLKEDAAAVLGAASLIWKEEI